MIHTDPYEGLPNLYPESFYDLVRKHLSAIEVKKSILDKNYDWSLHRWL